MSHFEVLAMSHNPLADGPRRSASLDALVDALLPKPHFGPWPRNMSYFEELQQKWRPVEPATSAEEVHAEEEPPPLTSAADSEEEPPPLVSSEDSEEDVKKPRRRMTRKKKKRAMRVALEEKEARRMRIAEARARAAKAVAVTLQCIKHELRT